MTRKRFLITALTGVATLATPKIAVAQPDVVNGAGVKSDSTMEPGTSASALKQWNRAVAKAQLQNSPIYTGLKSDTNGAIPAAIPPGTRRVSGITQGTFTTVNLQPEVIKAIAVYYVTNSGGLISQVDHAWIQGTASSVASCSFNYTTLDGGQTLCVYYTATLTNYVNFNQAFSFYAEFYADGSGWMNGGWL